jgi:hypothetical protein
MALALGTTRELEFMPGLSKIAQVGIPRSTPFWDLLDSPLYSNSSTD